MSWLEKKYINLLSSRLERFVWKSPNLANFRCCLCGDSKHNVKKSRAYIYEKAGKYWFHCHNESLTLNFISFLKRVDYRLWSEYNLERLAQSGKPVANTVTKTNVAIHFNNRDSDDIKALKKLPKISQLPVNHPAKQYIDSRQIPTPWHSVLRWTDNFAAWTNTLLPGKYGDAALKYDEGRIVIPFFDVSGKFYAYQGRCLPESKAERYMMIVLEPGIPVVFGADSIDPKKTNIWAFEGPIDSMFIPNSVAFGGSHFSDLTRVADRDRFTIAIDNEPHSADAKKKLNSIIDNGFRVVIWPSFIAEKDINAMVLAGYTPSFIERTMAGNTFEGIMAKAKAAEWSKV